MKYQKVIGGEMDYWLNSVRKIDVWEQKSVDFQTVM